MPKIEDRNDFKPWSEQDISDIDHAIEQKWSVEKLADFLCRAGTIEDVAEKMEQRRQLKRRR